MNIHVVAALLSADKALEDLQRSLKRQNGWRDARKIEEIRETLMRALAQEQESLGAKLAELGGAAING